MTTILQRKVLSINQRVLVSSTGGWKQSSQGVICSAPEPIETLQGNEYFYWVHFDTPQEDINDSNKYSKAQILSRYLEPIL